MSSARSQKRHGRRGESSQQLTGTVVVVSFTKLRWSALGLGLGLMRPGGDPSAEAPGALVRVPYDIRTARLGVANARQAERGRSRFPATHSMLARMQRTEGLAIYTLKPPTTRPWRRHLSSCKFTLRCQPVPS